MEKLNALVDDILQKCNEQGLDPSALLLRLHFHEELIFLAQFTQRERKQYAAQLIEAIFKDDELQND